ncbi:hypothetical protein RRG08_039536 [Elysia crispata]|uniref:Uncharacterized protein n=1 Tax=Elysia crispata TaxID=231223 RepID=A0AAE0YJQ9_9GAST|nr:hypothetical protein RRG08_039536 [Elysia crispata]
MKYAVVVIAVVLSAIAFTPAEPKPCEIPAPPPAIVCQIPAPPTQQSVCIKPAAPPQTVCSKQAEGEDK